MDKSITTNNPDSKSHENTSAVPWPNNPTINPIRLTTDNNKGQR